MSYLHLELVQPPFTVAVPEENAGDSDWIDGLQQLLKAALRSYNESVRALRTGLIGEALRLSDEAVHTFPYAPHILTFSTLLAAQHGSLRRARLYLDQLASITDEESVAPLRAAVNAAKSEWESARRAPDTLRTKYGSERSDVRWRELLLLRDRFGSELSDRECAYLQAYQIPLYQRDHLKRVGRRYARYMRFWQGVAATLALTSLTLGSLWWHLHLKGSAVAAPVPVHAASDANVKDEVEESTKADAVAQLSLAYVVGDVPSTALLRRVEDMLSDSTSVNTLLLLRQHVAERLFEDASEPWYGGDYASVFDLLAPIEDVVIGREHEKQYRLGVAADEIGYADVALRALTASIATSGGRVPYYHAEVHHRLALRGPAEDRRHHAKILVERYPNTPYVNSHILCVLNHD